MATNEFRKRLDASGFRAVEVAARVGVHKNTVSNWATGRTPVVPEHLRALALLLETSIDELAGLGSSADDRERERRRRARDADKARADMIDLLRRLLDNAGALRAVNQAAPRLMELLRDAETAVDRYGETPPRRGPQR